MAALLVIIAISVIVVITKDDKKPTSHKHGTMQDNTGGYTEPAVVNFDAYITQVDTDSSHITLCKLGTSEFIDYRYSGSSDIRNAYDKVISAASLAPGDFAHICATASGTFLVSLKGMSEVDSYKNVRNLIIEDDLKRMRIGETVYRYDENLLVLNEGYFLPLDMLTSEDMVTVCSIGGFVYLIKITSGHGYLELLNSSEFEGGSLTVDGSRILQITDNMNIIVSEGTHTFTVENGEYSGTSRLDISRDKTVYWDISAYLPEPPEYGQVAFNIAPYGAGLYIDGQMHEYDSPIALTLGEHNIQVNLTGHMPFVGKINVTQTAQTISITLPALPGAEDDEDDEDDEDENPEDDDSDEDVDSDDDDDFDDDIDSDDDDDFDDDDFDDDEPEITPVG